MELVLTRSYYEGGTNGTLRCEGETLCHTIELPWKNNKPCFSCIPEGRYRLSKRFTLHRGRHLLVEQVPGRSLRKDTPRHVLIPNTEGYSEC